ncbi:proline-rich protein 2-like [Panthera leo]|uniref:proline-rich protein 2-like n=1 Tax=Panthera leo TaxID=9689 RepID=UPI001C69C1B5|nr:proline-rich protein 2-like [Panthera leo]
MEPPVRGGHPGTTGARQRALLRDREAVDTVNPCLALWCVSHSSLAFPGLPRPGPERQGSPAPPRPRPRAGTAGVTRQAQRSSPPRVGDLKLLEAAASSRARRTPPRPDPGDPPPAAGLSPGGPERARRDTPDLPWAPAPRLQRVQKQAGFFFFFFSGNWLWCVSLPPSSPV